MEGDIVQMVRRLIMESERLYLRSEAGITRLPLSCRPGIFAARHIYAGIGKVISDQSYQTITTRARTTKTRKIGLMGLSVLRSAASVVMPQSAVLYAQPLEEVKFLVDAAADEGHKNRDWADQFYEAMAQLHKFDKIKAEA